MPAIGVKPILGQRAQLVLKGPEVVPEKLTQTGFDFAFPTLEPALEDLYKNHTFSGVHYLYARQWLPVSLDTVWDFISDEKNLERITPPWLNFKVLGKSSPEIQKDTLINYSLRLHGIPIKWRSEIAKWQPKELFVDTQVKGPYKKWYHTHLFHELDGGTLIQDQVQYQIPFYPFGLSVFPKVKADVSAIFQYRKTAFVSCFL